MKTPSQTGSAILWVLIAVALFAAIGFVIMQSSRGSTSMITDDAERAKQYSADEYANTVSSAVQRLKIRGCADDQISYETPSGADANPNAPTDGRCHVFRPSGGQVTYRQTE